MLIDKTENFNKEAVGCILTYRNKYFLVLRNKNNIWNSVTGNIEKTDINPNAAIKRELYEEINLSIEPNYLVTTYHNYDGEIIKYYLFFHVLSKTEFYSIKLNEENKDKELFTLEEALNLKLYEDEDYCLKLHNKKLHFKNTQ